MNAMELARMTGIMETLGNLPDGFFQEHQEELLCMAEEFVIQEKIWLFSLKRRLQP